MKTRYLTEEDYEILSEWWKAWNWAPVDKNMLPDNGLGGMMVASNGENICAGFLYLTNSGLGWVEFIISNPNIKGKKLRAKAINLLITDLCALAKNSGVSVIFTTVTNKNLEKRYLDSGFIVTDKGVNNYIKIL